MTPIGMMNMPADFKYEKAHLMGRPRHEKFSDFWRAHIPMDPTHRAKQFAPFDALAGFDDAIARAEVLYAERLIANE
jgi:hypothetical protein